MDFGREDNTVLVSGGSVAGSEGSTGRGNSPDTGTSDHTTL